jgi:DNA-directed RNA polymerase specialized sigma24 family protein
LPADRQASLGDEALLAGVRSGSQPSFNARGARCFGRVREERRLAMLAAWQPAVFRSRHVDDLPIEEIARRTTRSEHRSRSGPHRAKWLMFEAVDLWESDA